MTIRAQERKSSTGRIFFSRSTSISARGSRMHTAQMRVFTTP